MIKQFCAAAAQVAISASAVLSSGVFAAPVTDALVRASVATGSPARSVLLSAAQAGRRLVAVGERGIVVISDDGGRIWRQAVTPVSVTLTAVRFADASHGVAIGHGGTVLTTADSGQTWTRRLDGRAMARLALDAARASGDAAAVGRAEALVADGPDKPLLDVAVLDDRRFVVVGAYGAILATEDGGEHWVSWAERLDNPQGLHLYAIRREGNVVVLAGEQGLIFRSADDGRTFRRLDSPYKGSWFTAELPEPDRIVLAGLRGNVWQSRDGGVSWQQVASATPASITGSTRRANGSLLMSNQAGFVLELRDDRMVPLNAAPLPSLTGVLVTTEGGLFGTTVQGILPVPPMPSSVKGGSSK